MRGSQGKGGGALCVFYRGGEEDPTRCRKKNPNEFDLTPVSGDTSGRKRREGITNCEVKNERGRIRNGALFGSGEGKPNTGGE